MFKRIATIVLLAASMLLAACTTPSTTAEPAPVTQSVPTPSVTTTPEIGSCVVIKDNSRELYYYEDGHAGERHVIADGGTYLVKSDHYFMGITCIAGHPKVAENTADPTCKPNEIVWAENAGYACYTTGGKMIVQRSGAIMWPAGQPATATQ